MATIALPAAEGNIRNAPSDAENPARPASIPAPRGFPDRRRPAPAQVLVWARLPGNTFVGVPQAESHPFVSQVLATCRRRRLLAPGDRVLAALSGGPDSSALVAALAALRHSGAIAEVRALHVDHGLRPGSAADADACQALCDRLGVPLERARVAVGAGNLQAEARRSRYRALRAVARRVGATRIATGHTRTDQAETVLLHLLRGSGARGLSGIPPRRGTVVRPLVDRSRAEVLAFLRAEGLPWLEDPTNRSPRFLRNRVRSEVMPLLGRMGPGLERALARAADLLRDDERALERRAREALPPEGARAEARRLRSEPLAVRRRAVRRLWRQARGRRAGLSAGHVEAVLGLLRRGRPGRITLPDGLEARCAYGVLEIQRRSTAPAPPAELSVPGPGVYPVPGRALRLAVEAAPGAAVDWPLRLGPRRAGDRFRPRGGPGSKKLKAWLIDRKVPREARDGLLVLADRSGRVLWLPELGARAEVPGLALRLLREEA
jgi:tRNA(Ile)-lysidine synthase